MGGCPSSIVSSHHGPIHLLFTAHEVFKLILPLLLIDRTRVTCSHCRLPSGRALRFWSCARSSGLLEATGNLNGGVTGAVFPISVSSSMPMGKGGTRRNLVTFFFCSLPFILMGICWGSSRMVTSMCIISASLSLTSWCAGPRLSTQDQHILQSQHSVCSRPTRRVPSEQPCSC